MFKRWHTSGFFGHQLHYCPALITITQDVPGAFLHVQMMPIIFQLVWKKTNKSNQANKNTLAIVYNKYFK